MGNAEYFLWSLKEWCFSSLRETARGYGVDEVKFILRDHLILFKYRDYIELAVLDWRAVLEEVDNGESPSSWINYDWTSEFVSELFFEGAWNSEYFREFLSGKLFKFERVNIDALDLEMFYKRWLVDFKCRNRDGESGSYPSYVSSIFIGGSHG